MEIVSESFNFLKHAQARGKLGKPLAFVQRVGKQIFFPWLSTSGEGALGKDRMTGLCTGAKSSRVGVRQPESVACSGLLGSIQ